MANVSPTEAYRLRNEKKARRAAGLKPGQELIPAPLLEYQSPTGSLIATPPSRLASNVIPTIFIFLLVIIFLMTVVPINRVTEGYGEIIASKNVDLIQPLQSGIVVKIHVIQGQHVNKGDVLADLDPTFAQSDLGSLQSQYDSAFAAEERYAAEVANKPYVPTKQSAYTATSLREYQQDEAQYNSTMASYDAKIKGLQNTVQGSTTDLAEYSRESAISDQVASKRAELYKLNVGSELDLLSAQSQADELHREVESTTATLAAAKQDLTSMIAEEDAYKQSFYSQAAQSLASNQATVGDAGSQMAKDVELRQLVQLKADQPGTVLTVANTPAGSVVQSGDQLITLQPDDSVVQAQLDFPAELAPYLAVGQKVTIKFLAFNYSTHGVAFGHLISITPSSFLANPQSTQAMEAVQGVTSGPATPPVPQTSLPTTDVSTGLFYQGIVKIDKIDMRDIPPGFKPAAGMAVTGDDVVGTRTTMSLFLERIMPEFSEYGNVP